MSAVILDDDLDATDLFCGAGGSAIGLHRAGIKVRMAANHWDLAVTTHQHNFPDTDHDLADISQVDPRRYPRTRILWSSPECTNHSGASGRSATSRRRDPLPRRNGKGRIMRPAVLSPDAHVRSRATMWDVVRFAEHHRYDYVIVENVFELAKWELFGAWRATMEALGYQLRVVCLNSMFAGGGRYRGIVPAPQSRDRLYVVAWRKGMVEPNLDFQPLAFCDNCAEQVHSVQTWKPGRTVGRYRAQYTYNCPTCTSKVEPYARPALEAIDFTLPAQRIGDRAKPLADATMKRIAAGVLKFAGHPGLVVPVDRGNEPYSKRARSLYEVLPTQTARATEGVAFTPFLASLRGGGSKDKVDSITQPLATVTASGNHHLLVTPPGFVMRNNNSSSGSAGAEMCTPFWEPMRTITTKGHQSVVIGDDPDVTDCLFRMLQPHEQGAGMGFPADYVVIGNKREQTKQYGNAVTPPASELLGTAVVEALLASERRAA